ncbi:MAG: cyclodeaminase/cyclohydrolase family protein [Actinomycetia bacterium]|nr:cyclodeaminase/cyclohydrolase family protein [Actinomycetes bacterium]
MTLTKMTVTEFSEVLASAEPAPGGGSAAALEGALGAALVRMVAAVTVGKKRYAEHQELAERLMADAEGARRELLELIERDTEAFNGFGAALALPKDSDEEKAARAAAMQDALKDATRTPLATMSAALGALRLAKRAVGTTNVNAASDLGVGALSLKAAIQGAWLNVTINLAGITDPAFAAEHRRAGEAVLAEALPLADEIYEAIQAGL